MSYFAARHKRRTRVHGLDNWYKMAVITTEKRVLVGPPGPGTEATASSSTYPKPASLKRHSSIPIGVSRGSKLRPRDDEALPRKCSAGTERRDGLELSELRLSRLTNGSETCVPAWGETRSITIATSNNGPQTKKKASRNFDLQSPLSVLKNHHPYLSREYDSTPPHGPSKLESPPNEPINDVRLRTHSLTSNESFDE
ncbi:hypothetical protein LZ32DRAFT_171869 [Colletotrichum eremochloae]|nr:hypothetical protein LZ32DRAFT_171869 [Colletotrichum eremochloae]